MVILWMNLNFIELLTILQLITIQICSDGTNINENKQQKGTAKGLFSWYYFHELSRQRRLVAIPVFKC